MYEKERWTWGDRRWLRNSCKTESTINATYKENKESGNGLVTCDLEGRFRGESKFVAYMEDVENVEAGNVDSILTIDQQVSSCTCHHNTPIYFTWDDIS